MERPRLPVSLDFLVRVCSYSPIAAPSQRRSTELRVATDGRPGRRVPPRQAAPEPDAADVFGQGFEASFDALARRVSAACLEQVDWRGKVSAGISAALEFAAVRPEAARAALSADGGGGRTAVVDFYAERLREIAPATKRVPVAEEALVEAVLATVRCRLRDGTQASLPTLAPDLAHLVRLPYECTGKHRGEVPLLASVGTP